MLHIILYAIVPIIVVMAAGYISGKKGVFSAKDGKAFNKVVLDFALPAALFVSIVDANRQMLVEDLKLTIISLVVIMACFMAVYYIYAYCFRKDGIGKAEGAIMALVNGSPTIGFLGFAVLEPIFGYSASVALVVAIVGIVVNAVGIPVGLSLLNAALDQKQAQAVLAKGGTVAATAGGTSAGTAKRRDSGWKAVINALKQPVAWAPILAVIWVLIGIPWPKWASPSFDLIKGANASMAVFAAGITLSSFKISINWQAILGCILKMVLMPALLLIVGLIFKMGEKNLAMMVIAGALPPAFSGIIIADEYDTYVSTSTASLALSVILFIGFCPFWIWATDFCYNLCMH